MSLLQNVIPSTRGTRRPMALGRTLRFALTGGTAALCQLTLLTLLTDAYWTPDLANAVAFLLAAQINFALSSTFTWRDRLSGPSTGAALRRRWLTFHSSIAGMALVNLLVYSVARHHLAPTAASALGIAAAALGNFVIGDRLVFRAPQTTTARASRLLTTIVPTPPRLLQ